MPQKVPLSVTIITKNEEKRLPDALTSTQEWVDEIIVVDSKSTDRTQEIAKAHGAKVTVHPFEGYGYQKNVAAQLCRNDWILSLDADECVSPKLRDEIMALFQQATLSKYTGYKILFTEQFMGENTNARFTNRMRRIRLYNRNYGQFNACIAHDLVTVQQGKVGKLKHPIISTSYLSWHQGLAKLNDYSDKLAQVAFEKGEKPSTVKIIFTPFFHFCKIYFLKGYWRGGLNGVNLTTKPNGLISQREETNQACRV